MSQCIFILIDEQTIYNSVFRNGCNTIIVKMHSLQKIYRVVMVGLIFVVKKVKFK